VQTDYAAGLIYKYNNDFKSEVFTEFTSFGAGNSRQIRFAIKRKPEINDTTESNAFAVAVYMFDGEEEVFLSSSEANVSYTTIIDVPPPKIRIKLKGNGNFRIYVWAAE
jgi:hypothetical protein